MKITYSFLILIVLFFSLLLQMFHYNSVKNSILNNHLIGDEITHYEWGKSILKGDIKKSTPFFRAPLYGFFISTAFKTLGINKESVHYFQIIISFLGLLALILIGFECFSPFVGLFAGLFWGFYPIKLLFEGYLFIETLYVNVTIFAILFFCKFVKTSSNKYLILSSILLGLSGLSRPNIMIFSALLFFYILMKFNYKKSIVFLFYLFITILPFVFINYKFSNEICFISTQGGINFYAGNSNDADGVIPLSPAFDKIDNIKEEESLPDSIWKIDNMWVSSNIIARKVIGNNISQSEVSKFWLLNGIYEIINDPLLFIKRIFRKMFFLLGSDEQPNNLDICYLINIFFPVLKNMSKLFNFFILWVLFLPGIFIGLKKYPHTLFIFIYIFSMFGLLLLFFVNARFRFPIIPFMILYAGCFVEFIIYKRNYNTSAKLFLLLSILTAIFLSQIFRFYEESWQIRASKALFHNSLANAYFNKNDKINAMQEVEKAIKLNTNENYIFYLTKANIEQYLFKNNDLALNSLLKSIELFPHPKTINALSKLYKKMGKEKEANKIDKNMIIQPKSNI